MAGVPAHSPLIWPGAIATPVGPAANGTWVQAISAAVHGPLGGGSDTADFNAEGIVQKGYALNPWGGKYADSLIREGHLCFCHRGPGPSAPSLPAGGKGGADAMPHTIVSLGTLNQILQDSYEEAQGALEVFADRNRGLPGTAAMMSYLKMNEAAWAELFVDEGKNIRSHHTWKHLYYLTKQGICERWNILGFSILASAPDSQNNGQYAYLPLNVAFKGVRKYIANVWGENAGQGSNLFLILKRRFNKRNGTWGAFAFVPFSSNEFVVPLGKRAYVGLSGATEYGIVFSLGMVRDSRKMTLPEERLQIVQGLHPDVTPSTEREVSKQCPILDVAIHRKMRYTVHGF